ncbi:unnamed protein product [Mytilus coruscus]|uniref:CCHC-type domain-containing protein n=1 Tax=Mytilus coruscus TaxID=42192 RepID=A0A6J8CMB1_MYTCO|nr:unnamed protein product [Mytilus coruscus]
MKEFTSFATLHKIDHADDQRMIAAFHLNLTGPALTWFNSLDAEANAHGDNFLQFLMKTAKPLVANDNNPVQELQNQVKELTKALSELKSHSTDIKPGMPPKYQKPRYNNPRYNNNFSNQAGNNRPKTCFNCQAPGHYRANCNWNGHGEISLTLQCQLCQQFGHGAFQCHHHSNPGNQSNPGVIGHAPSGVHP